MCTSIVGYCGVVYLIHITITLIYCDSTTVPCNVYRVSPGSVPSVPDSSGGGNQQRV